MKKTTLFLVGVILGAYVVFAQEDVKKEDIKNAASTILESDSKLTIGGYGQIDYNQPIGGDVYNNGKLDVHRLVLLFGYKFNEKTQFVTELEMEHVEEVYVEQAFLNYEIHEALNLRAGLMLIPMGITNEYHEPPTFNGVERPFVDSYIAPTTWREIGIGFTGKITDASLKYQAYLVNGFKSYDGGGKISGNKGLRGGRQKGIESFMSSPNLTGRVDFYGIPHLSLGLSGYFGNTQSELYNGIDKTDEAAIASADSSVVGVAMVGFDARFNYKGIQLKGQLYYSSLSNVEAYNEFAGKDMGESMLGVYAELGYNVFENINSINTQLIPFVRYEKYNTHFNTANANDGFDRNAVIAGLGWKITEGAMLKTDMEFRNSKAITDFNKVFNMGVAVWF